MSLSDPALARCIDVSYRAMFAVILASPETACGASMISDGCETYPLARGACLAPANNTTVRNKRSASERRRVPPAEICVVSNVEAFRSGKAAPRRAAEVAERKFMLHHVGISEIYTRREATHPLPPSSHRPTARLPVHNLRHVPSCLISFAFYRPPRTDPCRAASASELYSDLYF